MKRNDWFFAILMFVGFIAYFYVMKLLGLYQNVNLRFFNIFINVGVGYMAMHYYRHHVHGEKYFSFANTFMAGVKASAPAVIAFALFQYFYLKLLDPGFMDYLVDHAPMGDYLNPGFVALGLIGEGLVGTMISSYAGMRLLAAKEHAEFPQL